MLLDQILFHVPCPIFWKNTEGTFLGCNELFLTMSGFTNYDELVGKNDEELPWRMYKEDYARDDQHVITTGKTLTRVENILLQSGRTMISETTKSPLVQDGKVIGVLGFCVDVTDRKEAERLKLENERHLSAIQEQEKFAKIADQVAHDIRSPLASLLMIVKACTDIPENERVALREAAIQIGDIANNLLNKYQQNEDPMPTEQEEPQSVLLSAVLLQLLTEKKYLYQNLSIKFSHDFSEPGTFAFIHIAPTALKRAISNVINNAAESLADQEGKIVIKLSADDKRVNIVIQDTGKGMPVELVESIMQNIAVTEGKKQGHGIGLTQVRETLQRNEGQLSINSIMGIGTEVSLSFPRVAVPAWMADSISLNSADIVIILDDDASIHGAWDSHFENILEEFPTLQIKHFTQAEETLSFINALSLKDRERVFLLTDYELLKQPMNGLDVVHKVKPIRSVLVTSHYANLEVQRQALKQGTKIIPKQLASDIPIHVSAVEGELSAVDKPGNVQQTHIDIVFVDDDPDFIELTIDCLFYEKKTKAYTYPALLLKEIDQYPKDTKFLLDHRFGYGGMSGLELAQKLHEMGYTRLYLFSGDVFKRNEIPPYVTLILKTNIKQLESVGNS